MVYMADWHHLPDQDIINLIMIISRSSMEVKITAGKIIDMSVLTFANVRVLNFVNFERINIYGKINIHGIFKNIHGITCDCR